MRRRTTNRLLSLLAVLGLAGCVATLPQPLTPVASAKIDKALPGTWRDEERTMTVVVEARDRHSLNITVTEHSADGQTRVSHYQGHTSILKGVRYLNLHGGDSGEGYLLLRYSAGGDAVELSLLDPEAARAAVRRGEIAGRADDSSYAPEVHLAADAKTIAAFVAKHQSELFKKSVRLLRIATSPPK